MPPPGDISTLNPADKILYDAMNGASPARTLLDTEKYLSDPAAQHQMLDIYSQDDKRYQSDGGTHKDRDKELLSIINEAARYQSTNAKSFTTGDGIVQGLLGKGKFTAGDLANYGYPDSVIQARLKNASPDELKEYNQVLKYTDKTILKQMSILTKWEDQLLRGARSYRRLRTITKTLKICSVQLRISVSKTMSACTIPNFATDFCVDIDTALKTDGVDDATRAKTEDLLKRKAMQTPMQILSR